MMTKKYVLDQEQLDLIQKVKEEKNIKNDSATLRYIIMQYAAFLQEDDREQMFINRLMNAYHAKYYAMFERLKWACQTSEMNSTILLDAINTLLISEDIDETILTGVAEAPIVNMSRTAYKEKIAYFKQKKDDRINRQ